MNGVDGMSSKKTNGRSNKKSVAPMVLSALTAAPAIITAIDKLLDKLPNVPSKVVVPQLYDFGFPLKLDQAITMLTNAGLVAMPSEVNIQEADPEYRNCVDSEVVGSNMKPRQKVDAGSIVIVRYITQEVIDESQRLFEELEKQKAETKRTKIEKRERQVEQAQKAIADTATSAKDKIGKIFPNRKNEADEVKKIEQE